MISEKITKLTLIFCLHLICNQNVANASVYSPEIEATQESNTLSFQAEILQRSASRREIEQLAIDAVNACYQAYRPNFDARVSQERARLAGQGHSSYYQQIPGIFAKSFAEAIINQISTLTSKIAPADRNTFWDSASNLIKNRMVEFCKSHNSNPSPDMNSHIDNLIIMKKTFG